MKRLAFVAALSLWVSIPVFAHRLDEYLQATTIVVDRGRVAVRLRLTPGVDVSQRVVTNIDANGDGLVSDAEQRAYAERVRGDLLLTLDGSRAPLRLVSVAFPKVEEMKEGLGEILLNFEAEAPAGNSNRRLIYENHHQSGVAVYLVNCLVPSDPTLRVTGQTRSYDQSLYQLDYTASDVGVAAPRASSSSSFRGWMERTGIRSLFASFFRHGIHHILTGYDHLLFVGALVLAASTLWELVKVVTAFTLAHTLTLTLAALNVVHLPERVVEPLISASILFVAMQNVFWPRAAKGWSRMGAAFFFGLFHGLGFAGGLLDAMREMPGGSMLLAILAFSLGVEAGHQLVVLPLFGLLRAARQTRPDAVSRGRFAMSFQRIGSAAISMAGAYYLCLALIGHS